MSQSPTPPLSYRTPPPPAARRRGWRKVVGWSLFVVVALVLFMLLSRQRTPYARISFTNFVDHLQAGRVTWVTVESDVATGQFGAPQPVTGGRRVMYFQTQLPHSAAHDWAFAEWLIENRNGANVNFKGTDSLVINILLPLIPWLLIFAFIWFIVFRAMRKAQENRGNQVVITGPGRWVPDQPQPAGEA
jgi:ATP-dependent Zn protease